MRMGKRRARRGGSVSSSLCEALESRQLLAGVTVITHGWQSGWTAPAWLSAMGLDVQGRVGEQLPIYTIQINDDLSSTINRFSGTSAQDIENTYSGEAVVLVDWAAASGIGIMSNYHPTTDIASVVTTGLTTAYPSIGIQHPLAELPIHLVGHSRGGSVVSEVSRLLGQAGVVVDQQTTLDPCPVSADPSAVAYSNTIFADNYYQTDSLTVTGSNVQGAHNVLLNGMSVGHTGVHAYYDGTIDVAAVNDGDGTAIPTWWYQYATTGPRDSVGFAWSRIGNMPRPDDGSLLEDAYRTAVSLTVPRTQAWDNVIIGGWTDDVIVSQGTHAPVVIGAIERSGSSTVLIGLDSDANPYDGVTWVAGKRVAEISAGVWQTEIDTSELAPGTYHLAAAISNGTHARYDYSLGTLIVGVAPPTDIILAPATVSEDQPAGAVVGTLSATDADVGDTSTYTLVGGVGSADNASFQIAGSQLKTAASFDYETRSSYSIRVRATDSGGQYYEKAFTVSVLDLPEFGLQQGKVTRVTVPDGDGDVLTFSLTGGGSGVMQLDGTLNLTNTTAKSVLTISVKKNKYGGDGVVGIGGITSDGLLKSINAGAAILMGPVRVNTLNQSAVKAAVSMRFRQMSNAGIQVQGLPVSSIAVSGDVSNSRIVTTGSITKFSAATLLDSDILVGVASSFAGDFASSATDFADRTAKLGSLTIAGRKLPKGSAYPAYVKDVHVAAPSVGTLKLANVDATAGAVRAHVLGDTGTLTIMARNPVMGGVSVLPAGTWKPGAVGRPEVFGVV